MPRVQYAELVSGIQLQIASAPCTCPTHTKTAGRLVNQHLSPSCPTHGRLALLLPASPPSAKRIT